MVSYNICLYFMVLGFVLVSVTNVEGHGRLVDPIARGSRWRFNESAPPDYNDNEGFCGGFGIQWGVHKGKCGLCGNSYGDAVPRAHEYGGTYGEGVVVKTYKSNVIDFSVLLTANHRGFFVFDLCNMDTSKESDECFAKNVLELQSGGTKYQLPNFNPNTYYNSTLKIPAGVKCEHCVFRWTYTTANTWGTCEDGSQGLGCGPQETFRGCSDVEIL